jgi:hypothetical protein
MCCVLALIHHPSEKMIVMLGHMYSNTAVGAFPKFFSL